MFGKQAYELLQDVAQCPAESLPAFNVSLQGLAPFEVALRQYAGDTGAGVCATVRTGIMLIIVRHTLLHDRLHFVSNVLACRRRHFATWWTRCTCSTSG